jgi:hypothetical protein
MKVRGNITCYIKGKMGINLLQKVIIKCMGFVFFLTAQNAWVNER